MHVTGHSARLQTQLLLRDWRGLVCRQNEYFHARLRVFPQSSWPANAGLGSIWQRRRWNASGIYGAVKEATMTTATLTKTNTPIRDAVVGSWV